MRSRRASLAVLALVALVAGCGFEPLYAPSRSAALAPELAAVRVERVPERVGQLLANELRDDFNPAGTRVPARYSLGIRLVTTRQEIAVSSDATASRVAYSVRAYFTLTTLTGGQSLLSSSAVANVSLDVTTNEYANVVGEQDAQTRVVRELAEEIRVRVADALARRERAT